MARGNYTYDDIREWSSEEVYFVYHYQELQVRQQQDFFASAMGIVWDKKQMLAMAAKGGEESGKPGKPIEKVFVPLSAAINPQIIEFVKGMFGLGGEGSLPAPTSQGHYIGGGEYSPKKGEKVVSMSTLSKRDFLALLGRRPVGEE